MPRPLYVSTLPGSTLDRLERIRQERAEIRQAVADAVRAAQAEARRRERVAREVAAIKAREDLRPVPRPKAPAPKPSTRRDRITKALDQLAADREALDRALWPDP